MKTCEPYLKKSADHNVRGIRGFAMEACGSNISYFSRESRPNFEGMSGRRRN
jgi:hypothetical protein